MTAQQGLLVIVGVMAGSVVCSFFLTIIVMKLAKHWQVVDDPAEAPQRKLQIQAVPLLGGLAIYSTVVIMTAWLLPYLTQGYLLPKHLIGIWLAGAVLMLGGYCDDRYHLSAQRQIIFPILAAIIVVASGIGISYITNPFGGTIQLAHWQWTLFTWQGLPYHLTLWTDLFTVIWVLGAIYTTKMLDGLDGLVSGIGVIGGMIICVLSLSTQVLQPETATLAAVFAGACVGFLMWNFAPAKVYLGEGGSTFIGFMLGVLAIISGAKIATALLVLGLPIIDIMWVILRRLFIEKTTPWTADTLHLHFQLRRLGWSTRQIVVLYYTITFVFGVCTVLVSSTAKLVVLAGLALLSTMLVAWVYRKTTIV